MSNDNEPATPINGPTTKDLECRIRDDGTTVEQWSTWAGMWDLAYHAYGPNDAQRYANEHANPDHRADYDVVGLCRQVGAIGIFEPFTVRVRDQQSVETARAVAIEDRYVAGFEHVHVRIVVQVEPNDEMGALADAYWRARQAPGGTIVDDKQRVHNGPEAQRIYDEMGTLEDRLRIQRCAALERVLVRPEVIKLVVPDKALNLRDTSVLWTGHCPADHEHGIFRHLRNLMFRHVEEWDDSAARWVMVDDDRTIITYCEGDLSAEVLFTPEAYGLAIQRAAEFYGREA